MVDIQRGPELRGKYKQQAGMKFAPQLWTTLYVVYSLTSDVTLLRFQFKSH